jgi:multidrug resistance efflux pump
MRSAFWLIGILVLIGSFVGVKLVLDQSASAQVTRKNEIDAGKPQDKIIAWGHFDVEQGIAGLYPKQFGDVVFVAAENTHVKAGDLLLQVDDYMARRKVELAKLDLVNSQNLVAKAKLLPRNYELQAEQQAAAVRAVELEIDKVQLDRKIKLDSMTQEINPNVKKNQLEFFDMYVKSLAEKKKAEEAKLKQIKLQDAKYDIAQADADLHAKEIQLEMAQELVKYHRILAPSDGMVLRVYTRKAESLGPNPRIHALEFVPDPSIAPIIVRAEVLQEWGHYVKVGQKVVIEDDTYMGKTWHGTVKSISGSYAQKRSPIIEPFTFNDVRTLECLITVDSGEERKFLGQRVRAKIFTNP